MTEFDTNAFLWDAVKELVDYTKSHSSEISTRYAAMCKLENAGVIPHLKKEAPLPIENETIPEPPPEPEPEPEPVIEEIVPDIVEEVVEEVVKDVVPEIVDPEPKPIESDNVDDLLEQYKKTLGTSN